jgi:hypothetical protein
MQGKFLTFLFLTLFAASFVAADHEIDSIFKPEGSMVAGHGSTKPVIAPLSSIPQHKEILSAVEEFNNEAGEVLRKENWDYRKPHFSPKHSVSEDKSDENILQSLSAVSAQTPIIKKAFAGIANQGKAQPDCNIAVGPERLMLAVNSSVAIFTKTGDLKFQTTFDEWFAPLTNQAGSLLFDPKLLYDSESGHFLFLMNARRADHRSWFLLSVSKTSDPEGDWAFYAFDMQITGGKRDIFWADFPRMGFDENAIYLTGNMHEFGGILRFRYAKIRVLPKAQVYKFGNVQWKEFAHLTDANNFKAIDIEPVIAFGTTGAGYLVNANIVEGTKLTLWKISNPGTTNSKLSKKGIAVSSYQLPPDAPQKGGDIIITTRDAGVYNAVFRDGSIYTAHNVAYDWGSGPVCAIRFYQIKTNGELVQEITYGKNGYSYFFPVVMLDSKKNVMMGFNRCSKSTYAGIFFTGRKASDPLGKFRNLGKLISGQSYYAVFFSGSNVGRWGDYNGISLDSDDSFYFFSEYAKSPEKWETIVGQLKY